MTTLSNFLANLMNGVMNKEEPQAEAQSDAVSLPWVDDTFRVEKTKWGTWNSFDKLENKLVISMTEDLCIEATRFYLKGIQDGLSSAGSEYGGTVGGKL